MDNAIHNRILPTVQRRLHGKVVSRVQAAAEGILIQFEEVELFVCLNPGMPFLFTMHQHPAAKTHYGHLAGQLNRHLEGMKIRSIEKPLHDRYFWLNLEDESATSLTLFFQAFPRSVELVLVDDENDSLVSLTGNKIDVPLQNQSTFGFYAERDEQNIAEAVKEVCRDSSEHDDELAGLSPDMLSRICKLLENDDKACLETIQELRANSFDLILAEVKQGNELVYQLFPAIHGLLLEGEHYSEPGKALPVWFGREARRLELDRISREIRGAANTFKKRSRRAIKKLEREVAQHAENVSLSQWGDLILANMHLIKRGVSEITVIDLFSESGEEVTIPIDPSLSPQENASRYYNKSAKAKRAFEHLDSRKKELTAEQDRADEIKAELEAKAEDLKGLRKLRAKLVSEGIIVEKKQKLREELRLPGRRFKHPCGARIIVGRSSSDNDDVTFRVGNDTDFWLHAAGIPGSHVILRNPEKRDEPLPKQLAIAAALAAYYSKARNSSNVQVHWTQRRFVKKLKGGSPGQVLLKNYRSIVVDPDKSPALELDL